VSWERGSALDVSGSANECRGYAEEFRVFVDQPGRDGLLLDCGWETGLDSRVRPRNALKGSAVGNRLIRHWCPGAVAASTGTLVSKDFQLPLRDSKLCVAAVEAH